MAASGRVRVVPQLDHGNTLSGCFPVTIYISISATLLLFSSSSAQSIFSFFFSGGESTITLSCTIPLFIKLPYSALAQCWVTLSLLPLRQLRFSALSLKPGSFLSSLAMTIPVNHPACILTLPLLIPDATLTRHFQPALWTGRPI